MPFSREYTAVETDIDELGHVNNAVYLRWIQDIAAAHWYAVASEAAQAEFVWVVSRHEIDYRAPTMAGEALTVSTWIGTPKGARFDRFVKIEGPDGIVRAEAKTIWVMMDRALMRPARIRKEIYEPFL
ncbi:MAG: acyl-CoA thioesterase [Pseudomonadota bacterium]